MLAVHCCSPFELQNAKEFSSTLTLNYVPNKNHKKIGTWEPFDFFFGLIKAIYVYCWILYIIAKQGNRKKRTSQNMITQRWEWSIFLFAFFFQRSVVCVCVFTFCCIMFFLTKQFIRNIFQLLNKYWFQNRYALKTNDYGRNTLRASLFGFGRNNEY